MLPFPVTAIFTLKDCAAVILVDDGVTITVGVIKLGAVIVRGLVPVVLLYTEALAPSGVYIAVRVSKPTASAPAATVIVALPFDNVVAAEL